MSVVAYKYGLLRPASYDAILDVMHAAHRYRNVLTEIERGRRDALRAAEREDPAAAGCAAAIAWLDAEATALSRAVKDTRSRRAVAKKKGGEPLPTVTASDRDALRLARARVRRAKVGLALYRCFVLIPSLQHERDRINELASGLRRGARALNNDPGAWGTFQLVDEAATKASQDTPLWRDAQPNDPAFVRWAGNGRVGVQIQANKRRAPMSVADLMSGEHTQLQLVKPPPLPPRRGTRRERELGEILPRKVGRGAAEEWRLRMRIGSVGRSPIWAEWPMRMHRPLPDGAFIKKAAVSLKHVGPREEWTVYFSLEVPRKLHVLSLKRFQGAVAIDIGWRKIPEGMRVAYWRGEDGRHGELVLSNYDMAGLRKPSEIRSHRDHDLDEMRPTLVSWLTAQPELPPWLKEATTHIGLWRSHKRFAHLAREWRMHRFAGDDDVYQMLEAWRRHDHHLWEYESGQRSGALNHRLDLYRCFAKELSERYEVVVLEEKFLSKVARRPEAGVDEDEAKLPREQRQRAAVSELCIALRNAFCRDGDAVAVEAAGTTITCHICGALLDGDAADAVVQHCIAGHVWDQDHNACHNLLTRYRERPSPEKNTGTARKGKEGGIKENKWAKAKRLRAKKDARREALEKKDAAE